MMQGNQPQQHCSILLKCNFSRGITGGIFENGSSPKFSINSLQGFLSRHYITKIAFLLFSDCVSWDQMLSLPTGLYSKSCLLCFTSKDTMTSLSLSAMSIDSIIANGTTARCWNDTTHHGLRKKKREDPRGIQCNVSKMLWSPALYYECQQQQKVATILMPFVQHFLGSSNSKEWRRFI